MADLITNLRNLSKCKHNDLDVADEAADEIEKLRAQIRIYKDLLTEAAREIEALKNNK